MSHIFAFVGALMFASSAWFGYALAQGVMARWNGERFGDVHPLLLVIPALAVGAMIGLRESNPLHLLGVSLVVVSLAALVRCDVQIHETPAWLSLVPFGCICAIALVERAFSVPLAALLVSLPFASVALMTKGVGMSWSDVRIAALGTSLVGLFPAIIAFSMVALLLAFVQWGFRRHTSTPIAPYLVSATAIAALAFGG